MKDDSGKLPQNEDYSYDVDENLIEDSFCPKCSAAISDKTDFCDCGFYVKASSNATRYGFVLAILLFACIIGVFITKTDYISSIGTNAAKKFTQKKMFKMASPKIQVETQIKSSGLNEQISKIYPKNYKEPNILIVEIYPEVWPVLKPEKRQYIKKTISDMWAEAYKGDKEPVVVFANPE